MSRYKRTPATCHPDRENHSRGLCNSCARAKAYKYKKEQVSETQIKKDTQRKDYNLSIKYNIGIDDYNLILEVQDYKCMICKQIKKLSVDHNHKTGQIRGLLCHNCNVGLGNFKDNCDYLKTAIEYLKSPNIDWKYAFKKREING